MVAAVHIIYTGVYSLSLPHPITRNWPQFPRTQASPPQPSPVHHAEGLNSASEGATRGVRRAAWRTSSPRPRRTSRLSRPATAPLADRIPHRRCRVRNFSRSAIRAALFANDPLITPFFFYKCIRFHPSPLYIYIYAEQPPYLCAVVTNRPTVGEGAPQGGGAGARRL